MNKTPKRPTIGPTPRSEFATWGGAAGGAIPLAGPFVQSLISRLVDDRLARFEQAFALLKLDLDRRGFLDSETTITPEELERIGLKLETVHEFIEGSIRSEESDRIERFVNILTSSLDEKGISDFESRYFLKALREINEPSFLVLCSHHPHFSLDNEFLEKHKHVISKPNIHDEITEEDMNDAARYYSCIGTLKQFNLIESTISASTNDLHLSPTEITLAGSRFLISCGAVKYYAVRSSTQKEFARDILHVFESLRDSNEALGLPVSKCLTTFWGFNPESEAHYSSYLQELFAEERWRSLEPDDTYDSLVAKLGRMVPIYRSMRERFESVTRDMSKDRDYRSHPLHQGTIEEITQEFADALIKVGHDPKDV